MTLDASANARRAQARGLGRSVTGARHAPVTAAPPARQGCVTVFQLQAAILVVALVVAAGTLTAVIAEFADLSNANALLVLLPIAWAGLIDVLAEWNAKRNGF